ncbi:MAG: hypothetical protein MUO19_00120 [Dehalococcoidales bacterium]|nr:hypothetical protein [Dehalococcoidales bacterium]
MKLTDITLYRIAAAVLLLAGIGIIILAFLNTPVELQIVLGFIGLGFIILALVPLKLAQRATEDNEKFGQLMAKLDEIKDEIQKPEEKPAHSGVAIADIINSGMKFYSDYVSKDKDKEEE